MPTENVTLTIPDAVESNSIVTMDQISDNTDEITSSNDPTADEYALNLVSSSVISKATSIITTIAQNINQTATSLVSSFTTAVSLLINRTLDALGYAQTILKVGKPMIFSGRDDLAPVIFYERAADKPVIVSDGAYGIERTIRKTSRVLSIFNQAKREKKPEIRSSKETSTITVAQTHNETETSCTTSWSYTVT